MRGASDSLGPPRLGKRHDDDLHLLAPRLVLLAGRGAGFLRVITNPVTSAAAPTMPSSAFELEPRLPLSRPTVPISAPPV
ncbi:MAG: hypothetical protein AUH42_02400 [Gemmatimonadetes bacterium 13_1_40CM_70_11]|nr:MAG: hypothetical protein AUH42_02400 [Gemmatimonadetes bacterium 13_1_40CM_70_11]